jgi:multiple antibiotic resistance protein
MSDIVNSFLLTFAALFPIVNPLEAAPFFLAITQRCSEPERHALARKVATNGLVLLLGSLLLGPYLLKLFGIDIAILRIAGGLVVASMGWKLLVSDDTWSSSASDSPALDSTVRGRLESFYPLTMPLTVGPGSISVAITIGSRKSETPLSLPALVQNWTGMLAGVVAIAVAIFLSYRFASTVARILGKSGVDVLVRLSAFVLVCIGLQIVWSGYTALSHPLAP